MDLDKSVSCLIWFTYLPITNYQLPITNYQLPITNYQLPIINYQLSKTTLQLDTLLTANTARLQEIEQLRQFYLI
jgi:hypothetical protein